MFLFRLLMVLSLAYVGMARASQDEPVMAQLVWVESAANNHQIFITSLHGEDWSEPQAVYQSENELASPVLVTDLAGDKWLVWSERRKKKLVLMSQRRNAGASTWGQASIVSNHGNESTAPAALVDLTGRLWLVWAANPGGMDDIFLAIREPGSAWTDAIQLSADNDVPDIRPEIVLQVDGDVLVSWQTFDFHLGGYRSDQKQFALDSSAKTRYKTPLDPASDMRPEEIALPGFLPGYAMVSLHLPNNRLVQSVRLN
ncbi:hypothetical protein [Arenicella chitinivorans]|uniref:hypothetical protein n=1 Tax=Arenicella chitinivorans TaxID=1329800 RepID=UPI00167189E9|nr:hypothetical protein [Arenicella chitinivorans]